MSGGEEQSAPAPSSHNLTSALRQALLAITHFMISPTFANASETLGSAPEGYLPTPLEREIRKIYDRSPLYGRRFPLHAEPLQWSCYREIPALSKKEIIEHGHQAFFAYYRE